MDNFDNFVEFETEKKLIRIDVELGKLFQKFHELMFNVYKNTYRDIKICEVGRTTAISTDIVSFAIEYYVNVSTFEYHVLKFEGNFEYEYKPARVGPWYRWYKPAELTFIIELMFRILPIYILFEKESIKPCTFIKHKNDIYVEEELYRAYVFSIKSTAKIDGDSARIFYHDHVKKEFIHRTYHYPRKEEHLYVTGYSLKVVNELLSEIENVLKIEYKKLINDLDYFLKVLQHIYTRRKKPVFLDEIVLFSRERILKIHPFEFNIVTKVSRTPDLSWYYTTHELYSKLKDILFIKGGKCTFFNVTNREFMYAAVTLILYILITGMLL